MGKFYDFITRGQRRKIQEHISDVLSKTQVSGLSYSRAVTLLAYVPNEKEFKDHFDAICQNVDFFIKTQKDVLLKEISKSEIDKYEKVIAVKIFVVNDWDFYSIDNVAFYLKEDDRGYRMLVQKDWFDKEPYNYYKEFPENICMGYCGCGGDVNRAYESDALHKMERFFTFRLMPQKKEDDVEEYGYNIYSKQNSNSPAYQNKENFKDEDGFDLKTEVDTKLIATSNAKAISTEFLKYKEKTYFVWEEKSKV